MAIRVFELARELGVTSKVVLEKCRAEEIPVKNHMATLSAGLEATIREWFSEGVNQTAVETAEHVDLESAREEARKSRRRRGMAAQAEEEAPVAEEAPPEAAEEAAQELPAEAETPAPAEEPAAAEAEVEAPAQAQAQAQEEETAPAEPVAEAPAPAPAEEAPVAAEPDQEPAKAEAIEEPTEAEPVSSESAEAGPTAEAAPTAEAEAKAEPEAQPVEPKPKKKEIMPAGPQVVPQPAKLKGPRVVRVEKPDFIRPPTRRTSPGPGPGPGPMAPNAPTVGGGRGRGKVGPTPGSEMDERRKKGKGTKRSPRRRGGRTADSGERLTEWRNQDLVERSERLAAAGGGLRRHRSTVSRKGGAAGGIKSGKVDIDEPINVKSLSAATGIKTADIIRRLMGLGTLATINQSLTREEAESVVADYDIELVVKELKSAGDLLLERHQNREPGKLSPRPPVVTFLGHVDHGKTSLLDYIRTASVASGEAGGITQHIGSYRYDSDDKHVVFLDTPGHEAFSAMRARGANMTDVVVLVVAADDGVMPQTVEAISHAKAAKVPIVVALNKIDVPNANPTRALGQLAEHGLQPREWGGDVEVIQTSAITGQGMDNLLETLSLEAELLELKAEEDTQASGFVIEAQMDPGMGTVARLLVKNGTLKVGDVVLAGRSLGRVRAMLDDKGRNIDSAGPASPVQISGLDEVPDAGDRFMVAADIDEARTAAEERRHTDRARDLATSPKRSLEDLLGQIEAGEINELAVIIKADVQGSMQAITGSLDKLATDEVRVNILHSGVGGVSTGDVSLAEASNAIIIAFNVVADAAARNLAEAKGVDIRQYRVIYDIVDDMQKALEEGLAPEIREEKLGSATVRQVFKVSRFGTIAGCYVTEGVVNRNARARVIRDNVVIADERTLDSLKRFKDDAREVRSGMECGLKVAGYDDIKEGDVLEFYRHVEVARKL